jgi:hypothetical protein
VSALRIVVSVVLLVMQVFQVRTLVEQRFGAMGGSSASAGTELREPVSRVPILVADPDLVRLLSDGWHVSPIAGSSFARLPGTEEATGETGTAPDSSPQAVAMIHGPDASGAEDTVLIYGCPCILGVTEPGEAKSPDTVSGELPVLLLPRGYVMKVMTNLPALRMDVPDLEDLGLRH